MTVAHRIRLATDLIESIERAERELALAHRVERPAIAARLDKALARLAEVAETVPTVPAA